MKDSLTGICKLFIENRDKVKATLRWESTYLYPLAASIYTAKNQMVQETKLRFCNDLIKNKTGIFSNFRGTSKLALASLLAVSENPEEKLDTALYAYDLLKQDFFSSTYLPSASMILAELAQKSQIPQIAKRTRAIYNLMKQEHPFLTSSEDSPFAAMIALSDRPIEEAVQDMESCYDILKSYFFSGNAVQSLTHVLSLSFMPAKQKCERVLFLFEQLKRQGYRYGTGQELASLGVLALMDSSEQSIIQRIIEVDEFLKDQKGFGMLGVGRTQRLMYAAILSIHDEMEELTQIGMHTAAMTSVLSLIIAEQTALIAAIGISAAAASSSNSNS